MLILIKPATRSFMMREEKNDFSVLIFMGIILISIFLVKNTKKSTSEIKIQNPYSGFAI